MSRASEKNESFNKRRNSLRLAQEKNMGRTFHNISNPNSVKLHRVDSNNSSQKD